MPKGRRANPYKAVEKLLVKTTTEIKELEEELAAKRALEAKLNEVLNSHGKKTVDKLGE